MMDEMSFVQFVSGKVWSLYEFWFGSFNDDDTTMEGKRDASEPLDEGTKLLKKPKLDMAVENEIDEDRMSEEGDNNLEEENNNLKEEEDNLKEGDNNLKEEDNNFEEDFFQSENDDELVEDIIHHYFHMPLPSKDSRNDDLLLDLTPEEVELLDSEDLPHQMRSDAFEIQVKLEISSAKALLLLHHFRWDAQKLLDEYFGENFEQYFMEHGLPHNLLEEDNRVVGDLINREMECGICFIQFRIEPEMEYPRCRHFFCSSCCLEYLKTRILEQGIPSLQCPEPNCNVLLDENYIKSVFGPDLDIKDRYDLLVLNDFVVRNKHFKYCPGKKCSKIWKMDVDGVPWYLQKVTCNCEKSYCFSCTNKWHFPLPCKLYDDWNARARVQMLEADENLTLTWIQRNTKPCPRCSSRIQKNGGCNHMICRNCRHEFIWPSDAQPQPINGDTAQERDELALLAPPDQAFLFNSGKFLYHQSRYKKEKQLLQQSEERMTEIRKAIIQILECRTLLKYSFALAFYLERDPKAEIFETILINLSNAVDELAHFLEPYIPPERIGENRVKVIDLTRFCEQRHKVLIELANEGYLEEKWCWSFRQVPARNP